MIPFPNKKYQVIYADPPWSYKDKGQAGKRGSSFKYEVMSFEEIQNLPIISIADDNCVLFLWVTMPLLPLVFEVITKWGFIYKTVGFVWVKRTIKDKLHWGMGNYTRSNAELCLLATRGNPKRISASVHSVIETFESIVIDAPFRGHSKKPFEVRNSIVELMGDIPRIELFATERIFGWDSWGYGVEMKRKPMVLQRISMS